jgi:hypothetical protein
MGHPAQANSRFLDFRKIIRVADDLSLLGMTSLLELTGILRHAGLDYDRVLELKLYAVAGAHTSDVGPFPRPISAGGNWVGGRGLFLWRLFCSFGAFALLVAAVVELLVGGLLLHGDLIMS